MDTGWSEQRVIVVRDSAVLYEDVIRKIDIRSMNSRQRMKRIKGGTGKDRGKTRKEQGKSMEEQWKSMEEQWKSMEEQWKSTEDQLKIIEKHWQRREN